MRPYISAAQTVVLSVVAGLILLVLVVGVVLSVQKLRGDPGPLRTADGVDLRKRRRNQLTFGALDLGIAVAVLYFGNLFAIVFGGLGGVIGFVFAILFVVSALATVLDRHLGPLPSTPRASRRRGAIVGVTVVGVIYLLTAFTAKFPIIHLWAAPVAAVTYAATAAIQWSRTPNPAKQAQYSG
ncbi:hypothetical protein AB0E69_21610 [Kribbella sp. NPDC026611]|uniref:hypothetical protein n=1 Tax=Kribbella sp. NPDC026611 TaxID=3154911 RepID=UPI0033FC7140